MTDRFLLSTSPATEIGSTADDITPEPTLQARVRWGCGAAIAVHNQRHMDMFSLEKPHRH